MKISALVLGMIATVTFNPSVSSGKGIDSLAPASETNAEADSAPGAEAPKAKGQPGATANPLQSTVASSADAPSRAYQIATSFGWAVLNKDSSSWRANGVSDVTISYRLPMKPIGDSIYATFRYAPMAVAPEIKSAGTTYAYTGVAEAYNFGGTVNFKIRERLLACGTAELGLIRATLTDAMDIPGHIAPEESGVNLTVGGGADWQVLPGFDVGPRAYLGFGTFTSFQLGATGTFSF